MNSDIVYFPENGDEHIGMLENVLFDKKTWDSFNRISERFAKKNLPIPISVLTKGILLILVAQGGIPAGAVFIQR